MWDEVRDHCWLFRALRCILRAGGSHWGIVFHLWVAEQGVLCEERVVKHKLKRNGSRSWVSLGFQTRGSGTGRKWLWCYCAKGRWSVERRSEGGERTF